MPRYQFVVLTRSRPGMEAEFDDWYDNQHMDDCRSVPGIISAVRHRLLRDRAAALAAPVFDSMAIYEFEANEPEEFVAEFRALADTPDMLLSHALDRTATTTFIAERCEPSIDGRRHLTRMR